MKGSTLYSCFYGSRVAHFHFIKQRKSAGASLMHELDPDFGFQGRVDVYLKTVRLQPEN